MLLEEELTILEKESAFTEFAQLAKLQKESGTRVANDKLSSTTAEKMASSLCGVITSTVIGYCNESRFTSLSGNSSEARKSGEVKDLVFVKLLAKWFSGYVPVTITRQFTFY